MFMLLHLTTLTVTAVAESLLVHANDTFPARSALHHATKSISDCRKIWTFLSPVLYCCNWRIETKVCQRERERNANKKEKWLNWLHKPRNCFLDLSSFSICCYCCRRLVMPPPHKGITSRRPHLICYDLGGIRESIQYMLRCPCRIACIVFHKILRSDLLRRASDVT